MEPLIIYHAECTDGFTAAWVARRYYVTKEKTEPECFAATYRPGRVELPDVTNRLVYILDFCPDRDQLEEIAEQASAVRVLDHHDTRMRESGDLPYAEFDLERSGAGMAWDHFFGGDRPWVVDYVEDRDLWRFKLPESRAINAYLGCREMTWAAWDQMFEQTEEEARVLGLGAELHLAMYVREMKRDARRIRFPKSPNADGEELDPPNLGTLPGDGYYEDIPVVNTSWIGASDLVGELAQEALFAVGWYQRGDGTYKYSLRSRGDFHVGELAQRWPGGGGHAESAGFSSETRIHG